MENAYLEDSVVYEANHKCHFEYLVNNALYYYRRGQHESTVTALYDLTPNMIFSTWRAFGVPENTLYRWVIQKRPDLNLIPEEFHAYLVDCNRPVVPGQSLFKLASLI